MHYNRALDKGGGAVAMATRLASGVFIHLSPHVLARVHNFENSTMSLCNNNNNNNKTIIIILLLFLL